MLHGPNSKHQSTGNATFYLNLEPSSPNHSSEPRIMSNCDRKSVMENSWYECARWLTRCKVLRADHRANWPNATVFDLAFTLRDGVLLCNLLNILDPGCMDIKQVNQKPQMAQFLCLRNIKIFLDTCSFNFHLDQSDLFEASMLFELTDFHRVLCTISALSNCARVRCKDIPGFQVGQNHSQKNIYKQLQQGASENPVEEEDIYGIYCSQAEDDAIYQDLCSPPPPVPACNAAKSDYPVKEKRDYVIQELVETENKYVEMLRGLLKHYAVPLKSTLRPEDADRIFFGIRELSEFHADFYDQLKNAEKHIANLARVFLDCREKFLIYGEYCANLILAQNCLQEACARNELVNQDVIKCQQEANGGRFRLLDTLPVPMQRVLKYHLLLDQLVKETPTEKSDERRELEKAKETMLDVGQYINDYKRDSDSLNVIKAIQASIVNWNRLELLDLQDFGRRLADGELKVKSHDDKTTRTKYVFLFEQAMLICKAGRGYQYHYTDMLHLEEYKLEDYAGLRTLGSDFRTSHQWTLMDKDSTKVYVLQARTDTEKQMWIKATQDAMENINPADCQNTDHNFRMKTFDSVQTCQRCGNFLKGRFFQGYRCETCRLTVHKQCIQSAGHCVLVPLPPQALSPLDLSPTGSSPPSCKECLERKLWFGGLMSKDDAFDSLIRRKNGTYMIRQRPDGRTRKKFGTCYSLSVTVNGKVEHMRVFKREEEDTAFVYLSDQRKFSSLSELVDYYEKNSLKENFERELDQRLMYPFQQVLVKALVNFKASESNQLSLSKGCRVVVLSQETEREGWWKGRIGYKVGFFPKDYVG